MRWDTLAAMPVYEASAETSASAEAAWTAWTDVEGWSSHDHIESASIDGEFRVGARITSKAKGLPRSSLTVVRAERPRVWTDESRSPGVRMSFDHLIDQGEAGTRLTERAHIKGPLGYLLGPLLRRRLETLFNNSVRAVARQAEAG
jgi:hypothetical protein